MSSFLISSFFLLNKKKPSPPTHTLKERSVFATRCLVETCLSLYRRGVPPSAPKSTLSLACLASGGALLSEDEVQLLSSWVGLCYMTLDDVGCPRFPGASATPRAGERGGAEPASRDGGSAALAGMAGFVRTTVAAFAAGGGSGGTGGSSAARRLLLAQAMAGGELGGAAKVREFLFFLCSLLPSFLLGRGKGVRERRDV